MHRDISAIPAPGFMDRRAAPPLSLYVHIPYCRTKCLYCDFNSYATQATPWREYLAALVAELDAYRSHPFSGRPLTTLFFGGGTPSLFPPAFYEALLPRIYQQFPAGPDLELTMECNPGTVTGERLEGYRAAGVNRLSFGVQSLDPAHLKTLTRLHGPQEAIDAVYLAKAAGFDNVSIDLMFGVPGQTVAGWEEELTRALELPLSHISVYNLTPEEGTALVKLLDQGRFMLPDEEYLVTMYRRTREILRAHGFVPYEISNFSRGRPCRHNLQYWTGADYLGIGAGAHSYSADGHLPWSTAAGAHSYSVEGHPSWGTAAGAHSYSVEGHPSWGTAAPDSSAAPVSFAASLPAGPVTTAGMPLTSATGGDRTGQPPGSDRTGQPSSVKTQNLPLAGSLPGPETTDRMPLPPWGRGQGRGPGTQDPGQGSGPDDQGRGSDGYGRGPDAPGAPPAAGCRWSTHRELEPYYAACRRGEVPIASHETLTLADAATETLLTRGRLMAGIDLAGFSRKFGPRARRAVEARAQPFVRRGLMTWIEDHLALTDEGVLVADSMIRALSEAADGSIAPERAF